jgi:hypothetical protein
MGSTADWEKLGETLDNSEEQCLDSCHAAPGAVGRISIADGPG